MSQLDVQPGNGLPDANRSDVGVREAEYRHRLRKLILDKCNGLIIDACDHRDADGVVSFRANSAFCFLPSKPGQNGATRRYYVTLSGLFRDRKNLHECLDALARAIDFFGSSNEPVDFLITCGVTGRYLAEYVLPRMVESRAHDTRALHLNLDHCDDTDLKKLNGRTCVIVCDVIAGGSIIRLAAQKLRASGANLVGCVAVVDLVKSAGVGEEALQPDDRIGTPLLSLTDLPFEDRPVPSNLIDLSPGVILNRLIADRRNGMLLGPDVTRNEDGTLAFSSKEIFRRVSGGYQRHFITLWPLFEKLLPFEECIDYLGKSAQRLRNAPDTYYSTIVTCTATGRHLLEHLQPRLETSNSVEAIYLGPYPYHALTRLPDNAFKGKSVLILTDVIASKTLVRNIASVIHRLDGTVTAILGVVRTLSPNETWETEIVYAPDQKARIESFCTFDVRKLTEIPSGFVSVDIDPETILPKEQTDPATVSHREHEPRAFRPFDLATTLRHFDESGALRVGIFEAGNRYFSAGIRLPKLFERFGSEIWERMKPAFEDQALLVTTTDRDDLRFLDFAQRWASSSHPRIGQLVLARYDSLEFDFPYFLPEDSRRALIDKRVIVLIHSAETAEKLRRLVSLLAQSPVTSVDVICLVNRMGDHSADFIARIKQMTSGIGQGRREASHRFSFHWVYTVNDLHGNELLSTWQSIQRLADIYTRSSPSPVFKSLFAEEMRYFRIQAFLNRSIEGEPGWQLPAVVSLTIDGNKVELRTLDSLLYAWFSQNRSHDERHQRIRQLLVEQTERSSAYTVLIFILSEISSLRARKRVSAIRRDIASAIKSRRAHRFGIETELRLREPMEGEEGSPQEEKAFLDISVLVMQETALCFSLALICFLDDGLEPSPDLSEIATSGLPDSEWYRFPLNFQACYGSSRTLWCVSLLLFFAHLEKALTSKDFESESQKLINLAHRYQTLIATDQIPLRPLFREERTTLKRRLAYSFDALLMDLGEHHLDQRDSVIIFLHNRVGHHAHHNALCKDVKEALTLLMHSRRVSAGDGEIPLHQAVLLPQSGESARRWKSAVDKGIQALAILQMVGQATAELFAWYRLAPKPIEERFRNPLGKDGFRNDIDLLRAHLSRIRSEGQASSSELTGLSSAYAVIERDLAVSHEQAANGESSPLRRAIDYYQPPIRSTIIEEMKSAHDWLINDYGPLWSQKADSFEGGLGEGKEYLVLADPVLLREILWNLFTNVRHGLRRLGDGGSPEENAGKIECRLEIPPADKVAGTRPQVRVEILSAVGESIKPPSLNDTWFRHQQDIRLYGGNLEFAEADRVSVIVTLELIRIKEAP